MTITITGNRREGKSTTAAFLRNVFNFLGWEVEVEEPTIYAQEIVDGMDPKGPSLQPRKVKIIST